MAIFHYTSRAWGCDITNIRHPFKDRTERFYLKREKSYELLSRLNKPDIA
jgi:hypothetical protein